MDTFYAILIIVAITGVVILIRKGARAGVNAAAKAVNQKVLFRNEHEEEQQLTKEKLTFVTTASVDDIMNKLSTTISTKNEIPVLGGALYELSRSAKLITYAFGNKLYPQTFVAAVSFEKAGDSTQGVFEFLRWTLSDGMIPNAEHMKTLRKQVWSAFEAADPSVKVTGTPTVKSVE